VIFDAVEKGDIAVVKKKEVHFGLEVQYLIDDKMMQNAMFPMIAIKDEDKALEMLDWLHKRGCKVGELDNLSQSSLFYAVRDGRDKLIRALVKLGLDVNHIDTYG